MIYEKRNGIYVPQLNDAEQAEMRELERAGELPTVIDRAFDLFFRFLLGRPDRVHLLMDLVNVIFFLLGYPLVTQLELSETELSPEAVGLKHSRLDIRAIDDLGRRLSIELQRETHAWLMERFLYYLGKIFTRQLNEGEDYSALNPTVMIMLLNFNHFKEPAKSLWNFMWMNPETQEILSRVQQVILVEMNKMRQGIGELAATLRKDSGHVLSEVERLLVWSSYLTNDERGVELVHTVLSKDKVFQQVGELEHEYWRTPDYRYLQLRAQLEEMDRRAIEKTHIMEATDLAEARGREEALLSTARRMKLSGLPDEQIAEFTGLSLNVISAL